MTTETTLADRYGAGVEKAGVSDKGAEDAAWRIIDTMPNRAPFKTDVARILVAAILEERKRCLDAAEYIIKNIQLGPQKKSRFSVFDLNRSLRMGARLVADRINFEDEKEWPHEAPLPTPGGSDE